jgi:CXXC-20-CXXC protein
MNYRECPNCHHKYSVKEYFRKFLFKFTWQSWSCVKCGSLIKLDLKRRIVGSFISAIALLGVFQLKDCFNSKLIYLLVGITILIIVYFLLIAFDKFKLVKKNKT